MRLQAPSHLYSTTFDVSSRYWRGFCDLKLGGYYILARDISQISEVIHSGGVILFRCRYNYILHCHIFLVMDTPSVPELCHV